MSGPGPYGSGPRSDPRDSRDSRDDQGGRHDVAFGPDISWPNGFRRLDTESRRLLEAGYGSGGYRTAGQYDQVDPRYGAGAAGQAGRRGYQQPAVDDFGYGDPGYSDPSYDGPRNPYTGPMRQLGYTGPQRQVGYQPDVYPTTGAQEALPATGPQPIAGYWTGQGPGYSGQRRPGALDGPRYDDSRFDDSRFDGGRSRQDDPRAGGPHHGGTHATDPRLEGIRYDELRYDEPAYDDEPAYGGPRYDQPLDDVSWYEELRRSAPSYPERPGGQPAGGQRPADPPRPADSPRPGDSRGPSRGQQTGYPQAPAREQPSGSSFPSGPSFSSGSPGMSGLSGYGQGREDRGGQGPQLRAAREIGTSPRPGAGPARPSVPPAPQALAFQDPGFREAPTVQVGVLTPPSGSRMYTPPAETTFVATAPGATQALAPAVRPGHGLDGPEITGSWPAQPQTDDLDSFEDFWREDDEDEEYRGLFGDQDYGDEPSGSRQGPGRRTGRRRGRSNDHRLWLALLGVVIAAAAAITAIIKFEFPSHGGPVHAMQTPARIGTFMRTVDMEKQTDVAKLREEVIEMSAGQASDVKSAVYESGNSAAGGTEQIIMFIGGHLANAAPATSITDFTQKFAGAAVVSVGSLGGQAACVEEGAGTSSSVSMCVWFDNDSFGEIVSPTMNAASLARVMRTVRPDLEIVVKN